MASVLKVDKLDPQSGTALEIGTSGDTVTVPSGVGLTLTDSTLLLPTTITSTTEVKTNKISPATGVAFALGDSGDTFTIPSGATITNSGTATGFGGGKVVQLVTATEGTAATYSTTTWTSHVYVTITPTNALNRIICRYFTPARGGADGSSSSGRTYISGLYEGDPAGAGTRVWECFWGQDVNSATTSAYPKNAMDMVGYYTKIAGTTSATDWHLAAKKQGANNLTLSYDDNASWMEVMEIEV